MLGVIGAKRPAFENFETTACQLSSHSYDIMMMMMMMEQKGTSHKSRSHVDSFCWARISWYIMIISLQHPVSGSWVPNTTSCKRSGGRSAGENQSWRWWLLPVSCHWRSWHWASLLGFNVICRTLNDNVALIGFLRPQHMHPSILYAFSHSTRTWHEQEHHKSTKQLWLIEPLLYDLIELIKNWTHWMWLPALSTCLGKASLLVTCNFDMIMAQIVRMLWLETSR